MLSLRYWLAWVFVLAIPAWAENNDTIFEAIKKGDSAIVEQYLAKSGDANARNSRGSTLIMIAASHRRYELVQLLQKHAADVGLVNRDGSGLLHYYIEGFKAGDKLPAITEVEVKPLLSELKKLPYIADRDGNTPLHLAVQNKSMPPSVIAVLISMQQDINAVNLYGKRSALHVTAAVHVPALLKAGANVDLQAADGNTPLLEEIKSVDDEKIKYLLAHGANIRLANNEGETVLTLTTNLQRLDEFLSQGADATVKNNEHQTVLQNFLDDYYFREEDKDLFFRVLDRLVQANPDLDYQYDHTQATALLAAAENGNIVAVRYLLAKGASAKVTSNRHTALTALLKSGSSETYTVDDIRLLLDAGVALDGEDGAGDTPLMLSMQGARTEYPNGVAAWLIEQGANVNHRNKQGATPLMRAVEVGNIDTIKLLLAKGAGVNARDDSGMSAILHPCCGDESFPIVRTLIESGANAADYSNSNRSLQLTRSTEEQVRYFLDHGYNPNILESKVSPGGVLDRHDDESFIRLLKERGALHDVEIFQLEETAFRAVEAGDRKELEKTIQAGYFFDNYGHDKYISGAHSFYREKTLLGAAIINRQPDITHYLLRLGARPDRAMQDVMETGDLESLKLLVEHGADVDFDFSINSKSQSRRPLYFAIEHKQTGMAHYLIDKGASVNRSEQDEGVTHAPLYAAIVAGDKAMVELLLKRGASLQDNKLLVEAYEAGQPEIAALLRSKGLVIPEVMYAITGTQQTMEEHAFATNNGNAPGSSLEKAVQNAIRYQDLPRLKQFVAEGYVFRLASVKQYDWSGDWHNLGNVIHRAAAAHATEMLSYIDEQSGHQLGLTPAMLAAAAGDLDTLKKTVTTDNLEDKNSFGTTAFYFAVLAHCEPCAFYLLEQGADAHVRPNYTGSRFDDNALPLLMVARWSLPLTQAIMEHDRKNKIASPEMYSEAMMAAIEADRMDIALALKKAGAIFSEHGGLKYPSVLVDAIRDNDIERVKQMLEVGADPNKITATAYGGYTALAMAFISNRPDIADLLLEHALKSDKPSPALQLAAEFVLAAHQNDALKKILKHPEVLDLDRLFRAAVESRNIEGLKQVMTLADKQGYALKDIDKTKADLQTRAEQWKDERSPQIQMVRARIIKLLEVLPN